MKPNRTRPRGDPNGGPPGKPPGNRSQHVTDLPPSYEELGIGKMQSSYWQAEARQRQKEAGKQGGRGKKKNLAETILQGFPRYERATDTQLARASGEENPSGNNSGRVSQEENLGAKMSQGFEPIKAVEGRRKPFPKQLGRGFPRGKTLSKQFAKVSEAPKPLLPTFHDRSRQSR